MITLYKNNLWGIVLAGGNATRLQEFTRHFYDHDRPKQYCAFIGSRSMVQHTIDRVKNLIDQNRILTVVAEKHLHFAIEQLKNLPIENLIIQPLCRETAPAVLLPILHLYHHDPESVVALFPSDHFILDESKFMNYVQQAKDFVNANPEIIITMGVRPDRLDFGYGWIKQGEKVLSNKGFRMYEVDSFIEKPQHDHQSFSKNTDYFWNTFVLVGKAETIVKHFQNKTPELYDIFSKLNLSQDFYHKQKSIKTFYNDIPSINFSKSILEKISHTLRVIDVTDVYWSDWGEEHRIRKDVERFNLCLNIKNEIELLA